MNDYNHKQFIEWLSSTLDKQKDNNNLLLVEAKLSKYWKVRAARRAKNTGRQWPNAIDRDWALEEQEKSTKMNSSIHALFEKELELSEEMLNEIDEIMKAIKKKQQEIKLRREAQFLKAKDKTKKKQSLSVPMKPEYGGVKKGFDKKVKKLKKKGVAAVAPGETFGPMEEDSKKARNDE